MESNTWCPRLTAAMILFGSAVQVKCLGSFFVSTTKRLIAIWRSKTDRNTPRLRRRRVSLAKKPSTALSQDAEVGGKWKAHRGCPAGPGAGGVGARGKHRGPWPPLLGAGGAGAGEMGGPGDGCRGPCPFE